MGIKISQIVLHIFCTMLEIGIGHCAKCGSIRSQFCPDPWQKSAANRRQSAKISVFNFVQKLPAVRNPTSRPSVIACKKRFRRNSVLFRHFPKPKNMGQKRVNPPVRNHSKKMNTPSFFGVAENFFQCGVLQKRARIHLVANLGQKLSNRATCPNRNVPRFRAAGLKLGQSDRTPVRLQMRNRVAGKKRVEKRLFGRKDGVARVVLAARKSVQNQQIYFFHLG